MAKFCFYSKNDPTQEAIGATEAQTQQEALKFFSLSKMLPIDQFQMLFGIKQFTYEESNKGNTKQLLNG